MDDIVEEPAAGHGRIPALFQQPQAVLQGRACHHAAFLVLQAAKDAFHALPDQIEALPGTVGVQAPGFGLGAAHGGVFRLHAGQGQVGHEAGHGRTQLHDGLLPVFRLARAVGTQAQGQTADLEPLGDEAVRLGQPGALQQRSRMSHHLMQGARLLKGIQAALRLAGLGKLEDGAIHGRFEMAQQIGPPFPEALAHGFRHPGIPRPPVDEGQSVPDGPGIRGGRAQGLDERVTGPAPFLTVHVRGQVGLGQLVQQQAGPVAAVPLRQLAQSFRQLAVQAGDVPYLTACLPDALPERISVGASRVRRGTVSGRGPVTALEGGQLLPDEVRVDAAEVLPLLPHALRRIQMAQGQTADIVQSTVDGPAHLGVHLMLDVGEAVRIGRQPVLQDGIHGFQSGLQGVPGLARETGQGGLAFLQGLPGFLPEGDAA